jgi:hypothetical protein
MAFSLFFPFAWRPRCGTLARFDAFAPGEGANAEQVDLATIRWKGQVP